MLDQLVTTYLEVRRALGFDLDETERMLRQYVAFAEALGDTHILTNTALDWCAEAGTAGQRHHRLRRVVLFARYARAEDPLHEVPPGDIFPRLPPQRMPYIYTPEEAAKLIAAAEQLGPAGSLRPHTVATIIGLLFATGMRVSEALALHLDDITNDGIVIRKTKFRKSRFIPLHDTAQKRLQQYIDLRIRAGTPPNHIFINYHGKPLGHRGLNGSFRKARRTIGLERPVDQSQPRVHDIRHTFAVRALEACPDGRDRIAQHMLALTTYLGHTNVADTYWYLRATPKLMRDIADLCETTFRKGVRS